MSVSAAPTFKAAFYAAAVAALPDTVRVSYGHPGTSFLEDDIVAVMGATGDQTPATMGTPRSREETIRLEVVVSSYRGGGAEAEPVAEAAAFALLGTLETYVRLTDPTVGGTVRLCQLEEWRAEPATDEALLTQGRQVELTATFRAEVRI